VLNRLGNVTTKNGSGATPRGGEDAYKAIGISLIRSLNVHDDGFREAKLAHIDDQQADRLSNVIVESNDVLLNITGASVARCCIAPADFLPARVNQHVSIIRPVGEKLDSAFLHYLLISKTYKDRLLHTGEEGGSTRQAITKVQLQNFIIEYPELLTEQHRIVAILDEAFDGIAKARAHAEQNRQNARALFESHLQSVFTQRGEGWVEKPLAELCERITKGSSPKWQGISYVESPGIMFVTSENVGEYELLLEKPKYVEEAFNAKDKKSILKNGDVLTNIVGASIGRTTVFDRDDVANINQAVCLIRCEPDLLNNHYLAYLLNSPIFKQVLHDNEVNNARANLSLGFFSRLPVPIPPIPKQKEIVARLGVFRAETQRLESIYQRKLAALDELKQSLLHQAFFGQL
nr:restriction endonuclease subunit S [Halothiobacillus sp.]